MAGTADAGAETWNEPLAGTRSAWVVERACFLIPPTLGAGAIGLVEEVVGHTPLGLALVLVGSVGYSVLSLVLAFGIVSDARALRKTDARWQPTPILWAMAAVFVAIVVGPVYLLLRTRRIGTRSEGSFWWLVVAALVVAYVAGTAIGVSAYLLALPPHVRAGLGLVGVLAGGSLPGAIYLDAGHVRTTNARWRPNPGTYLGLALAGLALVAVQPLVAGYYLLQRHRHLGVP